MKAILLPFLFVLAALSGPAFGETIYVGTYTKPGGSEGIYRIDFNTETGALKGLGLAAKTENPSFLALHPGGKFLYTVNEVAPGSVTAFAIQPDGTLKELNRESTLGGGATHLTLDREGKNALAANYGGGSVAVLPIGDDGRVQKTTGFVQHTGRGPTPRQKGPNAHSVYVERSNKRALVCDLGLDRVFQYQFDSAGGKLSPATPAFAEMPPGAGPRHLAISEKEFVYVLCEMGNIVAVFAREGDSLKQVQTITTLPDGFTGKNSTAEIFLHPNGRFLYASNRGDDSIAVFGVDEGDGKLKALGHTKTGGEMPRFFGVHPSGKWLLAANQKTGNVVVFKVDAQTGALTPTGVEVKVPEAVCVLFTGK